MWQPLCRRRRPHGPRHSCGSPSQFAGAAVGHQPSQLCLLILWLIIGEEGPLEQLVHFVQQLHKADGNKLGSGEGQVRPLKETGRRPLPLCMTSSSSATCTRQRRPPGEDCRRAAARQQAAAGGAAAAGGRALRMLQAACMHAIWNAL